MCKYELSEAVRICPECGVAIAIVRVVPRRLDCGPRGVAAYFSVLVCVCIGTVLAFIVTQGGLVVSERWMSDREKALESATFRAVGWAQAGGKAEDGAAILFSPGVVPKESLAVGIGEVLASQSVAVQFVTVLGVVASLLCLAWLMWLQSHNALPSHISRYWAISWSSIAVLVIAAGAWSYGTVHAFL